MQNQSSRVARKYAPKLRSTLTDGEQYLWSKLRGEQLGVKFRRQHPFGPYIADFACLAPKLVIEIDGSQHLEQLKCDLERDQFFAQHGFVTLRFWSNEVLEHVEGVLIRIVEAVEVSVVGGPHPNPPPEGEGMNREIFGD